ncbi:MAG TPA: RNB domain-containing ribonuclease, partial [Alphaproteobacteria bacterium]|nr:RNB domain-containing ribonuclease [Alphaproteobacteria bacterium]
ERFDSHKLIEEFMIAANVAAAETIGKLRLACMYRIHDEPPREKLESLRRFLDSLGIRLARGQVMRAAVFNAILARARDKPHAHMVNQVVLRSQSQAEYSPDNIGHFGLALRDYAHFTSPIRRYADLLVHRALIRGLKLGQGGLEKDHRDFTEMGDHISATERRATSAERSARDRFTAAYLGNRIGTDFSARISGVTRFGLFVTLDDIGGDGLIPIRTMNDDYYIHDEDLHLLKGRRNGRLFRLGDGVKVTLTEANPTTGGMVMELANDGTGGTGGKKKGKRKSGARRKGGS